jgi:hypothetical protein
VEVDVVFGRHDGQEELVVLMDEPALPPDGVSGRLPVVGVGGLQVRDQNRLVAMTLAIEYFDTVS